MTLLEVKKKSSSVLKTSSTLEELDSFIKEMKVFAKQSWLDDENRAISESMLCKLQIKKYLWIYYENQYQETDYEKLIACLKMVENLSTTKNYPATLTLAQNYLKTIEQVHPLIKDICAIRNNMYDSNGVRLMKTTQEYRTIVENMTNRIEKVNAIQILTLFPKDVNISSPLDKARSELQTLKEKGEQFISVIINENETQFLNNNTVDIHKAFKEHYMFYPNVGIEENRYANSLVINSPFNNEIRLFVSSFARSKGLNFSIIKSTVFEKMEECEIKETFELLKRKEINCLIEGLSTFTNSKIKKYLYQTIMKFGKDGSYIFMNDNVGDNGLYKEFVQICNESNGAYSLLDISSTYLSMPAFNDLIQLLVQESIIPNSEDEIINKIKKSLPFMGFIGLNELFRAATANKDWLTIASEISQKNYTSEVKEYLSKIPSQALLIDSYWGDFSQGFTHQEIERKEFDYDVIRISNPKNIRKIMESGFTIFEKCGLITRYCLLCGEDIGIWTTLDRESQKERIDEATKLVFQVLGIFDIVPIVEVLDKLSNPGAGGLCCDGGKKIQYKYSSVQNFEWLITCICHESFHAFQHMAYSVPYCRWFWTELGVTPGRVEEWRLNNKVYFGDIVKDFDRYRYQIIEADANAFEVDCRDSSGKVWNMIDFE